MLQPRLLIITQTDRSCFSCLSTKTTITVIIVIDHIGAFGPNNFCFCFSFYDTIQCRVQRSKSGMVLMKETLTLCVTVEFCLCFRLRLPPVWRLRTSDSAGGGGSACASRTEKVHRAWAEVRGVPFRGRRKKKGKAVFQSRERKGEGKKTQRRREAFSPPLTRKDKSDGLRHGTRLSSDRSETVFSAVGRFSSDLRCAVPHNQVPRRRYTENRQRSRSGKFYACVSIQKYSGFYQTQSTGCTRPAWLMDWCFSFSTIWISFTDALKTDATSWSSRTRSRKCKSSSLCKKPEKSTPKPWRSWKSPAAACQMWPITTSSTGNPCGRRKTSPTGQQILAKNSIINDDWILWMWWKTDICTSVKAVWDVFTGPHLDITACDEM